MRAISSFATGRGTAWVTIAACIVAIALAFVLLPRSAGTPATTGLPASAESQRVAQLLTTFPDADSEYAVVVWSRVDGGRLSTADNTAVAARIAALAPLSSKPSSVRADLAARRTAILVDMPVDASAAAPEPVANRIRLVAAQGLPVGLRAQLTGTVAASAGPTGASGIDLTLVLISAAAALLLLLGSRRPVLWLVQLACLAAAGWLAVRVAEAVFPGMGSTLTTSARDLVFGIAIGLGACYGLIFAGRYRVERRDGRPSRDAVQAASARVAPAIAANPLLVALGTLALLLSTGVATRAIAVSIAIDVALVGILALTLLPALAAVTARALAWPVSPRVSAAGRPASVASNETAGWRPVLVAVVAAAVACLVVFDLVDAQLSTGDGSGTLSAGQTQAQQTIDAAYGVGYGNQAIMLVPSYFAGETSTVAPTTLAMNFSTVHAVTRAGSSNGRSELIVALDADPGSDLALATVRDIRTSIAQTGGLTSHTLVGGADAAEIDRQAALSADRTTIVVAGIVALLVLALALVGLLLSILRSNRRRA